MSYSHLYKIVLSFLKLKIKNDDDDGLLIVMKTF